MKGWYFLLLWWLLVLLVVLQTNCRGVGAQPRIRNGDEAKGNDAGGNINVLLDFPDSGFYCTGVVVNREWMATAAHCVENKKIGDFVWIDYTPSNGIRTKLRVAQIGEISVDPNFDSSETLSDPRAPHDFAMIRIFLPLDTTCENGFSCGVDSPDVPMNAVFLYGSDHSFWLKLVTWFLSPGFFDRGNFYGFGYGRTDQEDPSSGGFINRRGTYGFYLSFRGFWQLLYLDGLFRDPAIPCEGDSGAPYLFRGYDKTSFAVAGIHSGGISCNFPIGIKYGYRLDKETADMIETNVESSGGSCERQDLDGDFTIRCSNPPPAT